MNIMLLFMAPQPESVGKNGLKHPVFKPLRFGLLPEPYKAARGLVGQASKVSKWLK